MILLSFDLETTGLSPDNDRPIEVGAVLYSTGHHRIMEATSFLVKTDAQITPEITGITGLVAGAVKKFGFESADSFQSLLEMVTVADAIIGQNVIRFDKLFYEQWALREKIGNPIKTWIDTRTDLPGVESKSLSYMLADIGKINPFPHSALADALGVLMLVDYYSEHAPLRGYASSEAYIQDMVKLAQSPTVILVGKQDRADNSLAKKAKFAWHPDYKIWWKAVKQIEQEAVVAKLPFNVAIAGPEVDLNKLWRS